MTTLTLTARAAPRRAPVALDPGAEVEPIGARPREPAERLELPEHVLDGRRQQVGVGRHVTLPRRVGADAHARVTDQLGRPAALGVDDGEAARERLEDDVRARVVHLRMQEHMRAAVDGRRVALGVAAGEENAIRHP